MIFNLENFKNIKQESHHSKKIKVYKKENFFHNKKVIVWFISLFVIIMFLLFGRKSNIYIVSSTDNK
jgi:quinol-cytochrome oxidoreductase complex cytochrome b subunit